jgi:photosystem II stability/assembly factor-like uncharacterized protein
MESLKERVRAAFAEDRVPPGIRGETLAAVADHRDASRTHWSATAAVAILAVLLVSVLVAVSRAGSESRSAPAVPPAPAVQYGQQGALTYPDDEPIRFTSAQVGWRIAIGPTGGASGDLYRTSDAGRTWKLAMARVVAYRGWRWFFDDRRAVVVGGDTQSGYRLNRTVDGGNSWQQAPLPSGAQPWMGTTLGSFASPMDGWILVGAGPNVTSLQALTLYQTTDGGSHWITVTRSDRQSPAGGLPVTTIINRMAFTSRSTGWITARGSAGPAVHLTTDGGRTWSSQRLALAPGYSPTASEAHAPVFPGGGREGFLPVYVDLPVPPGSPARSYYVRVLIYRTQDGGRTWSSPVVLPSTAASDTVISGGFLDADHWWLAGWKELWVTSDGGKKWAHFQPQLIETGRFGGMSFADAKHAYAVLVTGPATAALERFSYLESVDGGATWHSAQLPASDPTSSPRSSALSTGPP